MQLYIGNKNYSSWSMRPWLLMKQAGIEFSERPLRLDWADGSPFKSTLLALAPTGRVPLLIDDDGFAVWDSLAIVEYLAEAFPAKRLWPADRKQRARARSLCAEMHSGFAALRERCPMNVEASLPEIGARCRSEWPDVAADLRRIDAMWSEALAQSGGPFLFGAFGAVDAFLRAGVLAHQDLRAAGRRRRGRLCRSRARVAGDAGLVRGGACRERLPRGRRALSPARLGGPAMRKKADRSPLSSGAGRAGAQHSQRDLRRRAMKPIAPRPASISAYVSGSGTALIDSTLTAMSL